MQAYMCGISKEEFLTEIKIHQELDNFIKGTYNHGQKGCAVGCSIKSISKIKNIDLDYSEHINYETYLGIPEWLARVQDVIFEGLPYERSNLWPLEFSESIKIGANLNKIKKEFILFILKLNLKTLEKLDPYDNVKKEIELSKKSNELMINAYKEEDEKLIHEASLTAKSAATSAWSAARSAAWSAARSAAWSAARSAQLAAWSAQLAAWSAYEQFADELLRLIRECNTD